MSNQISIIIKVNGKEIWTWASGGDKLLDVINDFNVWIKKEAYSELEKVLAEKAEKDLSEL